MASPQRLRVQTAVIGGSGLYHIEGLNVLQTYYPRTPFGKPSDAIVIGELAGERVAFLPRHGKGHRWLPSEIPQRANFYALKTLGVEFVIGLSACGSLREEMAPRHFVFPDQILDRTWARPSTFFGGGVVAHVSFANPFSVSLKSLLQDSARDLGLTVHTKGTYVCMEGPAFSTKAESHFHRNNECDVVGMTALPEAKLAREAEMAYALAAMVTDYDCWKEGDEVSGEMVLGNLMANADNARRLVAKVLPKIKSISNDCASALKGAIFTDPKFMSKSTKQKLKPLISKYV